MRQLSGTLWRLAPGFTYAVLVILVKPLLKLYQPIVLIFLESFTATFILLPFTFTVPNKLSFFALVILIIMGILHTTIANILYLDGLRQLKVQTAGVLSYLYPLSASIFAFVFLKEAPSLETLLGGTFILLGNYLAARQIYAPRTVV